MKFLRKILLKLLGFENYLRFVSFIYISLIKNGFLKKQYPEIHFLKKIIKKDDICIDIGANLGYYSVMMSLICGEKGKVMAVEPVPLFQKIWWKNILRSPFSNFILYPYALGKENTQMKMGTPIKNGIVHHGMTKVADSANEEYAHFFDVEMKNPDQLFSSLDKLNFIKCDVEGYESIVFENLLNTISRFKPIIQSELNGFDNRIKVVDMLKKLNYNVMGLEKNNIIPLNMDDVKIWKSDFYFIPNTGKNTAM